MRRLWPRQKIIVYDLGLSPNSAKNLKVSIAFFIKLAFLISSFLRQLIEKIFVDMLNVKMLFIRFHFAEQVFGEVA